MMPGLTPRRARTESSGRRAAIGFVPHPSPTQRDRTHPTAPRPWSADQQVESCNAPRPNWQKASAAQPAASVTLLLLHAPIGWNDIPSGGPVRLKERPSPTAIHACRSHPSSARSVGQQGSALSLCSAESGFVDDIFSRMCLDRTSDVHQQLTAICPNCRLDESPSHAHHDSIGMARRDDASRAEDEV